ncbi:MAG: signal peptidase II [bacterium]
MESAPGREAARPRAVIRPKDGWFLIVAALVIGLDQLVKWVIRQTVELGDSHDVIWPLTIVHFTNSGAAFGVLQGAGPLLVMTSVIGMAAIVVYLFNPGFAHPMMRLGLALMLGGAVGNLIDRVKDGEVVDFIKVPHFPAFNVADSAITIGVLLLAWAMLQEPEAPKPEA